MRILKYFFGFVLLAMILVTARAAQGRSVIDAFIELARDPWGLATLADAYFGFLTFYLWVVYREKSWGVRFLWLALILVMGNIAMSIYALLQIRRLPPGASFETFLLRRAS